MGCIALAEVQGPFTLLFLYYFGFLRTISRKISLDYTTIQNRQKSAENAVIRKLRMEWHRPGNPSDSKPNMLVQNSNANTATSG